MALSIVPQDEATDEEMFLAFLEDRSYSPQTLLAYEADLKDLQSYAPLGVSTVQQADGFVSFLSARGLSASSIHRKVSTARSFYDYLVRYGLAPRNVFTGTPLPRLAQRLPVCPSGDVVADALAAIPDNPVGIRDRALITLLFQAGLRISEALSLTTESLGDLDRNEIRVIGKGDKERIAVCSVHVVAALKAYLAVRDRLATPQSSNALFLGSRGDDLSRRGAEKMMKKRFPSGETSPHHLRHGFANRVLQAGADINAVKELLGHSNIATTSVYLHTDVPQLHRAVEKAFQ